MVPILESLYVIDCVYLHVLNPPCIYKVKLALLKFSIQYLHNQFKSTPNGSSSMTKSHWRTFFRTIRFVMCFGIQYWSFTFFSLRKIKVHQRIQKFKEDKRKQLSELKENELKKNKFLRYEQKEPWIKAWMKWWKKSRIWKQNSLKQCKYQWAPNFEIMVKRKAQKLN